MLIVGDVHGKWLSYEKLLTNHDVSIQVGDLGVGYPDEPAKLTKAMTRIQAHPGHRFIRGNHDNPEVCITMPNWIPDGTVENDIMFMGGAESAYNWNAKEGIDWWPSTEEISVQELGALIEKYENAKPSIVISHDGPQSVVLDILRGLSSYPSSRTRAAFDMMFRSHAPDMWIFGHHHHTVKHTVGKTDFVCLAELDCIII